MAHDYDVVIIGSGFGGSVSALRLTEKGYRVAVLEAGRRFADDQFAATSWRVRRYLYAPALGCYGILRLDLLNDVLVMSGAGVGGGSLGYANTLYEPPDAFFDDPQWAGLTDWKDELAPWYDQAKRMLGATVNPIETPADRALRKVADDLGVGATYTPTPVGVLFGGQAGPVDASGQPARAAPEPRTPNNGPRQPAPGGGPQRDDDLGQRDRLGPGHGPGPSHGPEPTGGAGPTGGVGRVGDPFFGGAGPERLHAVRGLYDWLPGRG